jgi:carbonic anhydrase
VSSESIQPAEEPVSVTDEYLKNNETYVQNFPGELPLPPARRTAVVACMDPYGALGLSEGDSHVIRNAGGVVTDDTIRSLAISQHLLGTEEIVLIHHTDCGMVTFTDEQFAGILEQEAGERPTWTANAFPDVEGDVRESIKRIIDSPFVKNKGSVRGFVLDVATGKLNEVS